MSVTSNCIEIINKDRIINYLKELIVLRKTAWLLKSPAIPAVSHSLHIYELMDKSDLIDIIYLDFQRT